MSQGGRLLQWLPDGSLLTVLVPADRGPEPRPGRAGGANHPAQPRQGDADGDAAIPAPDRARRTPVPLLHHRAARDRRAGPGAACDRQAGDVPRRLVESRRQTLLRETLEEPFSYLVGFNDFARRLDVIDLAGTVVGEIRRRPLREAMPQGRDEPDTAAARGRVAAGRQRPVAGVAREPRRRRRCRRRSAEGSHDAAGAALRSVERAQTVRSPNTASATCATARMAATPFSTLGKRGPNGSRRQDDLVAYDLTAAPPPRRSCSKPTRRRPIP